MDMLIWILIIVFTVLVFVLQIPVRRSQRPVVRVILFIGKILLFIGVALIFVAADTKANYSHLISKFLVALYVALIGDLAGSIAEYACRRIRNIKDRHSGRRPCNLPAVAIIALVFSLCYYAYGAWNSGRIMMRELTVRVDGINRTHRFAFITDIHYESSDLESLITELCQRINEEAPEFVILGGDITDELTSNEDLYRVYEILSSIDAPTYFIYGNHDRQISSRFVGGRTYTDEELIRVINDAGIRILSDEFIQIDDDLVLLGREDMSCESGRTLWDDLSDPYNGALIVADHQPYDEEQLMAEQSVLQLSGHTHAGQLWPLQTVYTLLGLPAYGEFERPGTHLIVSAGAGDWMIRMRTEEHLECLMITLEMQ